MTAVDDVQVSRHPQTADMSESAEKLFPDMQCLKSGHKALQFCLVPRVMNWRIAECSSPRIELRSHLRHSEKADDAVIWHVMKI